MLLNINKDKFKEFVLKIADEPTLGKWMLKNKINTQTFYKTINRWKISMLFYKQLESVANWISMDFLTDKK